MRNGKLPNPRRESQMAIYCDICGKMDTDAVSRKEALETWRDEGWTIGKTVRCPKCSKREIE